MKDLDISDIHLADISCIPDDLLGQCFSYLSATELLAAELTCRKFKRIVEESRIWALFCTDMFPELKHMIEDMDTSEMSQASSMYRALDCAVPITEDEMHIRRLSAACKRLFSSLAACAEPDPLSIIADPVAASSTDHQGEHVAMTLSPVVRSRNLICYWSSSGSEEEDSNEWISFRLAHPFCVVTSVQVRPFKAWFQVGNPIYSPKKVQICTGGIPLLPLPPVNDPSYFLSAVHLNIQKIAGHLNEVDTDSNPSHDRERGRKVTFSDWMTTSDAYPIRKEDSLQTINLKPTICIGGYLHINLLGRTERQEVDNQYYTCIGYVRAQGRPVYNFMFVPRDESNPFSLDFNTPLRLKIFLEDRLKLMGGLIAVSEAKRLAHFNSEAEGDPNNSGSELGLEDFDLDLDEDEEEEEGELETESDGDDWDDDTDEE